MAQKSAVSVAQCGCKGLAANTMPIKNFLQHRVYKEIFLVKFPCKEDSAEQIYHWSFSKKETDVLVWEVLHHRKQYTTPQISFGGDRHIWLLLFFRSKEIHCPWKQWFNDIRWWANWPQTTGTVLLEHRSCLTFLDNPTYLHLSVYI